MSVVYALYRNFSLNDNTYIYSPGHIPEISETGWTRDGYNFVGWNAERDGSETMYQGGDLPGDSEIFYAIWAEVSHEVSISYSGSQIASMDASGTKTLLTEGKYCEDNIVIQYTKPSSSTPTFQTKTVSPSTSQQTVTADSGYDGLSSVTVNAISPIKSAQTYTPSTTDQTIQSGRWLSGNQTIKGDANLVASKIKKDVQIFGVTGSYEGSGGGGSNLDAKEDINFIDYDGTILYSYTASEFADLSALPANPSHEGLVAQGWNWTLADAKAYVSSYGKLWIGQMYITESGDTEIDVELQAPRLSPWLSLDVNGTVEVDWGDGSTKTTITGASQTTKKKTNHVYATDGSYTIKIHVVSGSFSLYGSSPCSIFSGNFSNADNNRVYANDVKRVRIGSSVTGIITHAFYNCYSLTSITIPSGVTSIGDSAFNSCYSLDSITIPSGVTSIADSAFSNCSSLDSITISSEVTSIGTYAFYNCYSLDSVTIPSGITSIGTYTFANCSSLASVTIPSGVTSIAASAFNGCSSLTSITIPSGVTSIAASAFNGCSSLTSITIPSGVTSIASGAFSGCRSLTSITIPSGVTSIDTYAFNSCFSLASVTIPSGVTSIAANSFANCYSLASITIPSGVTSIGTYAFNSCYSLASVTIPSGITSIAASAFSYCSSLASITIPSGVTSIAASAFANCCGIGLIRFERTTPPTVANSNAWRSIPTDCVIHVPSGSRSRYTSATNYPSSKTYTYVED